MISFLFQGFAMLLVAFLIGLPLGGLLARSVRGWLRQVRTDRVLTVATVGRMASSNAAPDTSGAPPADILPWSEAMTYPSSVFGHATLSMPVRRDHESPYAPPPADPSISRSLRPPAR
jgi:hypothetical protein